MSEAENPQLKLANDFVRYTGANIFLTGKAGTGKTTFLRKLKENSPKRMIVTAPTGVAAINAGGVTIHSFFQLPFGPQILPKTNGTAASDRSKDINKFSKEKINIIRSLDLLVIDEISMVRADLLDAVDRVLRRYKNRYKPFGGVQLLMIGDLQQLAPIVKEEEWEILRPYYDTPFFFSSLALKKTRFISIELQHIYRQSDERFINLLNKVRENRLDREAAKILNSRYIPDFEPKKEEGYITLTTHNLQSNRINFLEMNKIEEPPVTFEAEISGNFPEYSYPNEKQLVLKTGAQVMFVKNDASREKRYYNGKIGTISSIEEGIVYVSCPGEMETIATEPVEWHNYNYTIDEKTEEIIENLIGTFTQIPLRPAWAITIHKSQGLTFEKAIIDANAAFAHGQVYVALSRCRTLEGMVLSSKIDSSRLKSDGNIVDFMRDIESNQPDEHILQASRQEYEHSLITELNDFTALQRRLDYCTRLVKENENILQGHMSNLCAETSENLNADLVEVSRKFTSQINRLLLQNPDIENNAKLQERLIKGSIYYDEKTNLIFKRFFDKFILDCDNKAVKKSIQEALSRLNEEFNQKISCLGAVKSGFSISTYLEIRAKASIEKIQEKKGDYSKHETVQVSDEILNPELYILLKQWRNQKAAIMNHPAYLVLQQKTLVQLSNLLPQTLSQLKQIKGIGDKKISQYGPEILTIIVDFCENNGLSQSKALF